MQNGVLYVSQWLVIMIVKPKFTPSDTLLMHSDSSHLFPVVRSLVAIKRMHTRCTPDSLVLFCDLKCVDAINGGR